MHLQAGEDEIGNTENCADENSRKLLLVRTFPSGEEGGEELKKGKMEPAE